jgi:hypothetical protein
MAHAGTSAITLPKSKPPADTIRAAIEVMPASLVVPARITSTVPVQNGAATQAVSPVNDDAWSITTILNMPPAEGDPPAVCESDEYSPTSDKH